MDHVTDISSLLEIYEDVTDHSHDLRTDTYIHVPGPRENPDVSAGPPCSIGEFVSYPLTLCLGVGFAPKMDAAPQMSVKKKRRRPSELRASTHDLLIRITFIMEYIPICIVVRHGITPACGLSV